MGNGSGFVPLNLRDASTLVPMQQYGKLVTAVNVG